MFHPAGEGSVGPLARDELADPGFAELRSRIDSAIRSRAGASPDEARLQDERR
jgi:hypothetical protein